MVKNLIHLVHNLSSKKISKRKLPSDTFCALPWMHLSTRPDGNMRVCCTANASSVGPTNDKEHGGQVGILRLSLIHI